MKSTKKALLLSITSMLLCVAMLMGTTFAWFTDSVTSGTNKIVAGNLDIEVSYKVGGEWKTIEGVGSLFDPNALWEPGHTEYVTLKIENKGTLALKYKMNVSPISETGGINVNGQSFKLSDYLVFGTTAPAATEPTYTRESARNAVDETMGLTTQSDLTKESTLPAKGATDTDYPTQYITLVVYMPENVGNEANYKTGTTAPSIDLGITVVATQLTSEKDSFDNQYDKDADYDPAAAVLVYNYFPQVNVTGQLEIDEDAKISKGSEAAGTVTVTQLGDDATKSKVVMSSSEQIEGTSAAKLETILKKANGDHQTGSMTLKVVKDDTANANFQTKEDSPIDTTKQDSTTYQVTVETEGVVAVPASANKAKFKVDLFIGMSHTNVKMYHDGALMTTTSDEGYVADAPETFIYNASTGYVTMYVDDFSPFTAVYDMPVAAIGTTVYYSLADAITAAQNKDVIVLLSDTKENVTIPVGMTLTLNLNGKTLNGGNQTTAPGKAAITNYGTLTVTGNGTIKREDTGASAYYVIANPTGTLTFDESFTGTVTNGSGLTTSHAGASVIVNGTTSEVATLNIKNGNFQQTNFNVIKTEECSIVNIYGGTISSVLDYAVLSYDNLTISGGTINGSVCTRSYGAFDAVTTISGGTVGKVISAKYNSSATYAPVVNISGGNVTTVTTTDLQNSVDGTISITGGTYSSDPKAYVAEGYKAVDNGNGTWTVKLKVAPKPDANGVFTANTSEELADVLEELNTNDAYTTGDYTVQLGAGDIGGTWDSEKQGYIADVFVIKQWPEWNGNLGNKNDENNLVTPPTNNTRITIVGSDTGRTNLRAVFVVVGHGYSQGGDRHFSAAQVRTEFKNIDFDFTNVVGADASMSMIDSKKVVPIYAGAASYNVIIDGCNFKETGRLQISQSDTRDTNPNLYDANGKVQQCSGYSYSATIKNSTFTNCIAVLSAYAKGNYTISNVTATGVSSGFVNEQSGECSLNIENCTVTGSGYGVRTNGGNPVTLKDCSICISGGDNDFICVRKNAGQTFNVVNCTIPEGGSHVVNFEKSATVKVSGNDLELTKEGSAKDTSTISYLTN